MADEGARTGRGAGSGGGSGATGGGASGGASGAMGGARAGETIGRRIGQLGEEVGDKVAEGAPFQPFEPGPPSRPPSRLPSRAVVLRNGAPRLRDIPFRMVVPNLVTIFAICLGLTGVRLAFEGRFGLAIAVILAAAFLDGIDGTVARMLKASSRFGEQLDSLADVVNFGVAPALVLFAFTLHDLNSLGWIAALVYAIAMTLRLARFNAMLDDPSRAAWQKSFFTGVPAPAGAGLVLLPVYLGLWGDGWGDGWGGRWGLGGEGFALVASLYTLGVALLLVSALPVYSGKAGGGLPSRWVAPAILALVAYVALLVSYEWPTLTFTALAYLAFLPVSARMYRRRARGA